MFRSCGFVSVLPGIMIQAFICIFSRLLLKALLRRLTDVSVRCIRAEGFVLVDSGSILRRHLVWYRPDPGFRLRCRFASTPGYWRHALPGLPTLPAFLDVFGLLGGSEPLVVGHRPCCEYRGSDAPSTDQFHRQTTCVGRLGESPLRRALLIDRVLEAHHAHAADFG